MLPSPKEYIGLFDFINHPYALIPRSGSLHVVRLHNTLLSGDDFSSSHVIFDGKCCSIKFLMLSVL